MTECYENATAHQARNRGVSAREMLVRSLRASERKLAELTARLRLLSECRSEPLRREADRLELEMRSAMQQTDFIGASIQRGDAARWERRAMIDG